MLKYTFLAGISIRVIELDGIATFNLEDLIEALNLTYEDAAKLFGLDPEEIDDHMVFMDGVKSLVEMALINDMKDLPTE